MHSNTSSPILIRIFLGGAGGQAKPSFINARGTIEAIYREKILIESLNTDQLKEEGLIRSPKDLIDWFLGAHIHIAVGHLHQGLEDLSWDMEELLREYQRLRCHIGFPAGSLDPAFIQDKILYHNILDDDDHLPTLKIAMPKLSEDCKILISTEDVEALRR
jgi:hypothetical protein